jgi:DNA topoisomerase-3
MSRPARIPDRGDDERVTDARCLNRQQAAAYCGCDSLSTFADWVRRGIVPGPIPGTHRWDRRAIDAALEASKKLDFKPVSPAQMLYAKKIARGKAVVIPEEAKANSAAMSQWIDSNRSAKRRKRGGNTACRLAGAVAAQSTATTKRSRKRKADGYNVSPRLVGSRKAKFDFRYAATNSLWQQGGRSEAWRPLSPGWMVCPTGADLSAFGERGWL